MEYSVSKIKETLSKNNFNCKKKFGQNFIVDKNIIDNIIKKSEIDKDTLVIEIGPGAGSLTSELGKFAGNVLAYEIDTSLKDILKENILDNTKVIYEDFLKRNVLEDIKKYEYKKLYVVANLPYYITTPIIVKIIEDNIPVDKMVLMVQKEVGNRFKAKPNSKEYNSLSIFLNYYFDINKILDVSRNVFIPKPNVDSIVVMFTRKEKLYVKDEKLFFKLIRDSFKQKRKTLRNNLKNYDLEKIEKVLNNHNMDLSVRAEAIPIEIFIEIANELISSHQYGKETFYRMYDAEDFWKATCGFNYLFGLAQSNVTKYNGEVIYGIYNYDLKGKHTVKFKLISSKTNKKRGLHHFTSNFIGKIYDSNGQEEELPKSKSAYAEISLTEDYWRKQNNEFIITIDLQDGYIGIKNGVYDDTNTFLSVSSFWGAMKIKKISPTVTRFYCNDAELEDDFDDLIFDMEIMD